MSLRYSKFLLYLMVRVTGKKIMTRITMTLSFVSFAVLISLTQCGRRKSEMVWDKDLPVIGSQSSPRTADLYGDVSLDIVIGAGKNELQFRKHSVLAIHSKT